MLDSIEPAEQKLYDLQYIDAGPAPTKTSDVLRRLPYTGPRWYPRVAAEFMLHHDCVTWADFRWGFNATAHLSEDAFVRPLQIMEEAWGDVPELPKRSINAALGILGCPRLSCFFLKTGENIPEASGGGCVPVVTHCGVGGRVVDWVWEMKLMTNVSHRPIHDAALFTEHTRVAQALCIIRRLHAPCRNILCVKTDAVVFHANKKCAATLKTQVESLSYRDLAGLRGLYEPPLFAEQRRHREQTRPVPIASDAQVFRLRPGEPSGVHHLPSAERICVTLAQQPEDVCVERARALVQNGQSLLILGPPGTGKTYLMKEMVAELRATGKKVVVVAKTHCAVQNASGDHTANHFVHKYVLHGSSSADCIVIEEISQVDVALWGDLARLQFVQKQFILLGDHEQFGPIGNQWRGTQVDDELLQHSSLLRELCPYRLTLTENIRSDPPLFAWYTSQMPGGCRYNWPMDELVAATQAAFPVRAREVSYTLCLSHRKRIAVNGRVNLWHHQRRPEAILIKAQPCPFDLNKPQDFWRYQGQQLIGCARQGSSIKNGCFYIVKVVTPERVELEEGPVMSHAQAGRCLRLTHALTQASCQGLTLQGVVRAVETSSSRFTRRRLYVCISRATAFTLVEVA